MGRFVVFNNRTEEHGKFQKIEQIDIMQDCLIIYSAEGGSRINLYLNDAEMDVLCNFMGFRKIELSGIKFSDKRSSAK